MAMAVTQVINVFLARLVCCYVMFHRICMLRLWIFSCVMFNSMVFNRIVMLDGIMMLHRIMINNMLVNRWRCLGIRKDIWGRKWFQIVFIIMVLFIKWILSVTRDNNFWIDMKPEFYGRKFQVLVNNSIIRTWLIEA